ncbi:NTPase [Reticulomyxa filosa]|uniref:NTPase n=1 Tax=Reticulomyxa filosa TaxID=46433 RepID=X6MX50_RETFI|nr:NTPase [Reticulomyxa filosa]|eukprot:ETO18216.1 NTPase [Reticulomyxa filosa]
MDERRHCEEELKFEEKGEEKRNLANAIGVTEEETKQKLKECYKSQDELAPLVDDVRQPICTCYIRLLLLPQQIFEERKKDLIKNKTRNIKKEQEKREQDEAQKEEEEEEESEKWSNVLDDVLMHNNNGQGAIEVQDLWNMKKTDNLEVRHISIHGEAGMGKSTLTQRIVYLWANDQLWNNRFEWLLRISLKSIVDIFDNKTGRKKKDRKSQWSKIMKEMGVLKWDKNDTNVLYSKNGLLLLDGFDEIVNELNKNPELQTWLQECMDSKHKNRWVIMTSRRNSECPYLDCNAEKFHVVGFQTQDIQKYVRAYFQNVATVVDHHYDHQSEAELLIQTLHTNQSLSILSHIPYYLRFFCYLTRQKKGAMEKKNGETNDLDNISISKLFEVLVQCYMQWDQHGATSIIPRSSKNTFLKFKMEMDYLSNLAWEGLKADQAVISCDMQQRVIDKLSNKYHFPQNIVTSSQWSHIRAFLVLQGQVSRAAHPSGSVYFPHLLFQEWFAAYYLVHCLYEPEASEGIVRHVQSWFMRNSLQSIRW